MNESAKIPLFENFIAEDLTAINLLLGKPYGEPLLMNLINHHEFPSNIKNLVSDIEYSLSNNWWIDRAANLLRDINKISHTTNVIDRYRWYGMDKDGYNKMYKGINTDLLSGYLRSGDNTSNMDMIKGMVDLSHDLVTDTVLIKCSPSKYSIKPINSVSLYPYTTFGRYITLYLCDKDIKCMHAKNPGELEFLLSGSNKFKNLLIIDTISIVQVSQ